MYYYYYFFVQRTFPGVGLRSVDLLDLHPNEDYTVKIRCGAQQNFWKWGDWSDPVTFRTKLDSKELVLTYVLIL